MIKTFDNFNVRNRGCVMLKMDFPKWESVCAMINPDDVYESENPDFGISQNPHVTILYGLYSFVSPEDVEKVIKPFHLPEIYLGAVGIFNEHPDFEVVKINVISEDLTKMNLALCGLPHEEIFSYNPHVTISYVKKGTAIKYKGIKLEVESNNSDIIYSTTSGQKILMKLNG